MLPPLLENAIPAVQQSLAMRVQQAVVKQPPPPMPRETESDICRQAGREQPGQPVDFHTPSTYRRSPRHVKRIPGTTTHLSVFSPHQRDRLCKASDVIGGHGETAHHLVVLTSFATSAASHLD